MGPWGHSFPGLDYLSGYFCIKCSIIFLQLKHLKLIWREGLSSSDLLAQVEGKDRLRNGTLFLQVVKDGDGSYGGHAGVVQAQDVIKGCTFKPIFLQA